MKSYPCIFLILCYIKIHGLPCTLDLHVFVTSFVGHLENTGSLSCAGLPNVDTFHYTISKILYSHKNSVLRVSKLLSSQWWTEGLQNSNFCLKVWILSVATNAVHCFLDRLTLFLRKCQSKNGVPWKQSLLLHQGYA